MNLVEIKNQIANQTNAGELLEHFLEYQDIKPKSKSVYRRSLKQFLNWIGLDGLNGIDRRSILAYRDHLKKGGKSPYTISSYLAVVRKFFEWTESMRYCPNVAKGVKGAKAPKTESKSSLSIFEAKRLLDMDRKSLKAKRNFAMINLIMRLGLRTIEVIRANIGDIQKRSGVHVLYIQGKGRDSKDDFMILTEETLNPLYDYLEARNEKSLEAPLFAGTGNKNNGGRLTTRSISRIIKNRLKAIGIDSKKYSAHSLRHTAITFALLAGATIQEAQMLARHSNINTTTRYAHNIDRIQNAPERFVNQLMEM